MIFNSKLLPYLLCNTPAAGSDCCCSIFMLSPVNPAATAAACTHCYSTASLLPTVPGSAAVVQNLHVTAFAASLPYTSHTT